MFLGNYFGSVTQQQQKDKFLVYTILWIKNSPMDNIMLLKREIAFSRVLSDNMFVVAFKFLIDDTTLKKLIIIFNISKSV